MRALSGAQPNVSAILEFSSLLLFCASRDEGKSREECDARARFYLLYLLYLRNRDVQCFFVCMSVRRARGMHSRDRHVWILPRPTGKGLCSDSELGAVSHRSALTALTKAVPG